MGFVVTIFAGQYANLLSSLHSLTRTVLHRIPDAQKRIPLAFSACRVTNCVSASIPPDRSSETGSPPKGSGLRNRENTFNVKVLISSISNTSCHNSCDSSIHPTFSSPARPIRIRYSLFYRPTDVSPIGRGPYLLCYCFGGGRGDVCSA